MDIQGPDVGSEASELGGSARTHPVCWGRMDEACAVTRRPRERLDPPVVGGMSASASEVEG